MTIVFCEIRRGLSAPVILHVVIILHQWLTCDLLSAKMFAHAKTQRWRISRHQILSMKTLLVYVNCLIPHWHDRWAEFFCLCSTRAFGT